MRLLGKNDEFIGKQYQQAGESPLSKTNLIADYIEE
jgi:hypothetical protein